MAMLACQLASQLMAKFHSNLANSCQDTYMISYWWLWGLTMAISLGEQRNMEFLTIGLSLPDSICHTPQSREYEEDRQVIRMRPPEQEGNDTGKVGQCSWKLTDLRIKWMLVVHSDYFFSYMYCLVNINVWGWWNRICWWQSECFIKQNLI